MRMHETMDSSSNSLGAMKFINREFVNSQNALKPLKDQNRLFKAMSDADWQKILPYIEAVDLPVEMILSTSNMKRSHVYFPSTAVISILH